MATRTKKHDAKAAEIAERQKQALNMRRSGASLRDIGAQLGVSHIQIRNDLEAALEDLRDEVNAEAQLLRAQELSRLDTLQMVAWNMVFGVQKGLPLTTETKLKAIDRILRISQARRELLGLNAPTKFVGDLTVTTLEKELAAQGLDPATFLNTLESAEFNALLVANMHAPKDAE